MAATRPSGGNCASLLAAALAATLTATSARAQDAAAELVERGAYVFHAAGCGGCHTDVEGGGAPLAGGRALTTVFGTFRTPNITPDPEHGIGAWSLDDFRRSLRLGIAPDGSLYYPSFPYDSFTLMSDEDIAALYAYLMAQPPADTVSPAHALDFPFDRRWLLAVWRWLYFEEGPRDDAGLDPVLARGRYVVDALAHCGACHTPRTALGGRDVALYLAGNADGPEGETVPNITPDEARGIGRWSRQDLVFLLTASMLPDGDTVSGSMAEVVRESTSRLSADDLDAMLAWLAAVPAIDRDPGSP